MKCPYRKKTVTKHLYNADETTEEFCDCYKKECPFYNPGDREICWKAVEDGGID